MSVGIIRDHYNSQALVMGGLAATLQKCGDALTGIARTPWRVYVEAVVGSKMLGGKRIGYVVEVSSDSHFRSQLFAEPKN